MSLPERIKRALLWLARKGLKRKKAGVILVAYYNGSCPVCEQHIGTDIFKDKLTQEYYAFCGSCGREIFQHVDKSKILWLKPYEPV